LNGLGIIIADSAIIRYIALPITAFVVEPTPNKPYLGFKLNLDPPQLCDIITQTRAIAKRCGEAQIAGHQENSDKGLFVSHADESLLDCAP
jgi:hypothetical protein